MRPATVWTATCHSIDQQGRTIRYLRPTPNEYVARQRALGVQPEFIQVMRSLYWTVRPGIGAKVTPELGELLQ